MAKKGGKRHSAEEIVHKLRIVMRLVDGRSEHPTMAIFDVRTLQSILKSGSRAGYDGHKKKNDSKIHIAVDTLGNLPAFKVTPVIRSRSS